jgi:hypothetical protein
MQHTTEDFRGGNRTMTAHSYDSIVSELLALPGVTASQMFGMPTLKAGGKAFAGNLDGDMVFKLTGDAHARALAITGAHLFDPMGGRPMKEWVLVPAAKAAEWAHLADAALEYCSSR